MLIQMLPAVHDRFSCDAQLSSQIARSVGMEEKPISEYHVKTKEVLECDQLPVEADSWYTTGEMSYQCLKTVRSYVIILTVSEPEQLVCTSVKIVPVKKERHISTNVSNRTIEYGTHFSKLTSDAPPPTDEIEENNPHCRPQNL